MLHSGIRLRAVAAVAIGTIALIGCNAQSPIPPGDLISSFSTPQAGEQATQSQANSQLTAELRKDAADRTTNGDEAAQLVAALDAAPTRAAPQTAVTAVAGGTTRTVGTSNGTLLGGLLAPRTASKPAPATVAAPAASQGGTVVALLQAGERANTTTAASRTTVTTAPAKRTRKRTRRAGGTDADLPGVNIGTIFGVAGARDVEHDEEDDDAEEKSRTRLAFVPNLSKRGTHGLILQRPNVKVGCFPPQLVRLLKRVQRRYGRPVVVTSGFRSRRHNRMIGGSRRSTHVQCRAADIQVKGVSKWRLAKFLRSLPGRGGVGTYCHTKSVHIDIGKVRAWHHCRRKRRRRRA